MAETGPGKDDLRWHRQCIRTVGGITSGWALVHTPPLAARLVHALVKLLSVGSAPRPEPEAKVTKPWGFWTAPWDNNGGGSQQRRDRRSRGESLGGTAPNRRRTRGESMGGGDDRRSSSGSGGGRGGDREGWKHRREVEERRMEELQNAALQA